MLRSIDDWLCFSGLYQNFSSFEKCCIIINNSVYLEWLLHLCMSHAPHGMALVPNGVENSTRKEQMMKTFLQTGAIFLETLAQLKRPAGLNTSPRL
jgi:hypothetical protein